jgi:hypothetical protein
MHDSWGGRRSLTTAEASTFLGIAQRTLHEHARLGQLPHRRFPYARALVFYVDELEAWRDGEIAELEVRELPGDGRAVVPVRLSEAVA